MDDIVKAALQKWPNVPHCFGWLALDARGHWRMRDERAQAQHLPGDKIVNAALLGFINRNYQHDEQGRWYFQNGPQRVYLDLEATPYIARVTPHGLVLHTGEPLTHLQHAYLSQQGTLFLLAADQLLAQVDDRDMASCLEWIKLNGQPVGDESLMTWLDSAGNDLASAHATALELQAPGQVAVPIKRGSLSGLMAEFHYVSSPEAD